MKISKITKVLPLALALAFCMPATFAEGESPSANAVYQLNLPEYLKIATTTANPATDVTFDDDYAGANLESAITGSFKVVTNLPTRAVYLQATCAVEGDTALALYSPDADPTKIYIVLTNEDHLPTASAVTAARGGSSDKAATPDTIALALTPTTAHDNFPSNGIKAKWDNAKNQIEYTILNGTGTFDYTTSEKVEPTSFSTHDTKGTYKATLTMTKTSL